MGCFSSKATPTAAITLPVTLGNEDALQVPTKSPDGKEKEESSRPTDPSGQLPTSAVVPDPAFAIGSRVAATADIKYTDEVIVLKGHVGTVDSVTDANLYVNWDINEPAWNTPSVRNIVEKAAVLPSQVDLVLKESSTDQQKAEADLQAAEMPQNLQGSDHRQSHQAVSDEALRDPADKSQEVGSLVLEEPQRTQSGTRATAKTPNDLENTPEEKIGAGPITDQDAHKAGQADSVEALANSSSENAPSTSQDSSKAGQDVLAGAKSPSNPPSENGEKSGRKVRSVCC